MMELMKYFDLISITPTSNDMLKVNYRNARPRCEMFSNLAIKTPERRQWCHSGAFIVNFEHISHHALVFPLLTGWD